MDFFDSDMKGIFKQKMVENLLDGGSSNESALERVAGRLLQPEVLGAVASGASAALAKNQPVRPAGYDSPNYDPYAGTPVQQLPVTTNASSTRFNNQYHHSNDTPEYQHQCLMTCSLVMKNQLSLKYLKKRPKKCLEMQPT